MLLLTTIFHLSAGLVIAAMFIDDSHRDAQIGLIVLASAFGVLSIAAAFAIHKRPLLSPWLVLGLLPGVVGAFLVLR